MCNKDRVPSMIVLSKVLVGLLLDLLKKIQCYLKFICDVNYVLFEACDPMFASINSTVSIRQTNVRYVCLCVVSLFLIRPLY